MRRAIIDVSVGVLADIIGPLEDAGINIVATLLHPCPSLETLRFVVEGLALPERCQHEKLIVSPLLCVETYGRQRMTKLSDIRIVGPYSEKPVI